MRYYRELGYEYVENGTGKVKGSTIQIVPHPQDGSRMLRVFIVQNVIRQSDTNPIVDGTGLGLSFPKEQINSRDYTWKPEEEKMTPLKIQLHD